MDEDDYGKFRLERGKGYMSFVLHVTASDIMTMVLIPSLAYMTEISIGIRQYAYPFLTEIPVGMDRSIP